MIIVRYKHKYTEQKGEKPKEEWEVFKLKNPRWKLYWVEVSEYEKPDKSIKIPEEAAKAEAKKNKENDNDSSVNL